MLVFRIRGVCLKLYFGFFAMLTFYYYFCGSDSLYVCAALVCCLLHESGHLAAMLALGRPPKAVCFYAGGIKLVPADGILPRFGQTVVLAAGCGVNMLLAGISAAAGLERLAYINLAVMLINLLPLSCLDGGRILALYVSERTRRMIAAVAVIPLCAAAAVISPPTAVMLAVFSAAAELIM